MLSMETTLASACLECCLEDTIVVWSGSWDSVISVISSLAGLVLSILRYTYPLDNPSPSY